MCSLPLAAELDLSRLDLLSDKDKGTEKLCLLVFTARHLEFISKFFKPLVLSMPEFSS